MENLKAISIEKDQIRKAVERGLNPVIIAIMEQLPKAVGIRADSRYIAFLLHGIPFVFFAPKWMEEYLEEFKKAENKTPFNAMVLYREFSVENLNPVINTIGHPDPIEIEKTVIRTAELLTQDPHINIHYELKKLLLKYYVEMSKPETALILFGYEIKARAISLKEAISNINKLAELAGKNKPFDSMESLIENCHIEMEVDIYVKDTGSSFIAELTEIKKGINKSFMITFSSNFDTIVRINKRNFDCYSIRPISKPF